MALFSVLESIGPAAEAAVPVLTEIVQDSSERNDFVLLKARMALGAIGTPRAKSAGEAADLRSVDQWLQKASREDIKQAVAQQSYLIRRQLRSQRLSEEVIEVSVNALRPMGRQAADAVPALLRAWGDPRIGTTLRALIAAGLAAAGVKDVEAAAARLRAEGRPDPLAEIIGDTRSGNHLVSTLAMAELGDLGPSDKVIDALISALDENRNPGQAALVLGRFGTVAAKAIPSLLPHLAERESGANAIQALGLIGVRDGKVVSALSRIVADKSSPHRAIAVASLGSLRAVSALPELRAALLPPDKYTRILAANALGSFGAEAASAVPELSAMLEDPDTDVKVSAVHSLGLVGPAAASAVPRIARQLQHPDQRLKTAAVSALERIGGQEALAALELDARRYAEADRAEYLLQGQTTGRDGLRRFVDGLSRWPTR
jgi:HEAT repeat protein